MAIRDTMEMALQESLALGDAMKQIVTAFLLSCIVWCGPSLAQSRNLGPATGTVSIRQLQVAFIGSGAVGGGELKFGRRVYGITVGGLGIGGIGASTLRATGTVYGLKTLDDFAGAYVQLREG